MHLGRGAPQAARFGQVTSKSSKRNGGIRQPHLLHHHTSRISAAGGSFHPQKEYIQLLERFCREHDLIFIFDEVQANFGSTGELFAFTSYGVEPDIVVLGKGLGNGVAVSAAVGRADLFVTMNYGHTSDTWSGNPLSSAAVLATLDEYAANDVIGQGKELSKVIEAGLLKLNGLPGGRACSRPKGRSGASSAAASVRPRRMKWPTPSLKPAYYGDEQGRAIHLHGPLAAKCSASARR